MLLTNAVQGDVHPFNHRACQPSNCARRLICIALDDHLVVTDENRHGSWALAPTFPKKSQGQLQAIGSRSLNRRIGAVGQLLDVHAAPSSERASFAFSLITVLPGSP